MTHPSITSNIIYLNKWLEKDNLVKNLIPSFSFYSPRTNKTNKWWSLPNVILHSHYVVHIMYVHVETEEVIDFRSNCSLKISWSKERIDEFLVSTEWHSKFEPPSKYCGHRQIIFSEFLRFTFFFKFFYLFRRTSIWLFSRMFQFNVI